MAKKRMTNLQKQFQQEQNRILNAMKKATQDGYEFDNETIDKLTPKQPKRVTVKTIKQLKEITNSSIKEQATKKPEIYVSNPRDKKPPKPRKSPEEIKETRLKNLEKARAKRQENLQKANTIEQDGYKIDKRTGEIISSPETQQGNQYNSGYKEEYPQFSDMVIANYLASLSTFPNGNGVNVIRNWLNSMINEHGKDSVAQMLEDGASSGLIVSWKVAYKDEETASYITGMVEFLPEAGELTKEEIVDRFDSGDFWDDVE